MEGTSPAEKELSRCFGRGRHQAKRVGNAAGAELLQEEIFVGFLVRAVGEELLDLRLGGAWNS